TIGGLAAVMEVSKSGLYAHSGSKEKRQLNILDFAADRFRETAVLPARTAPDGPARMRCIVTTWEGWAGAAGVALTGGCAFVAPATELDDAPDGPDRDRLVGYHAAFQDVIQRVHRSAITVGALVESDSVAFSHTLYAHMLGYHFARRMMRDPAAGERTR